MYKLSFTALNRLLYEACDNLKYLSHILWLNIWKGQLFGITLGKNAFLRHM